MSSVERYTPKQFAIFRVIFGLYLILHTSCLFIYAPDVFGRTGMLPDPSLNFTYGYFPDPLYFIDSPTAIYGVFTLFLLLSACFVFGIYRRTVSFILWFLWAALYNRNNFILNPGIMPVGWLLLACTLIPKGEVWCLGKPIDPKWRMPKEIFWGCWIVMAVTYSISGILKAPSSSWHDGSAVYFSTDQMHGRDWWLTDYFLSLPTVVIHYITWTTLALEVFFLPLSTFKAGRAIAWCGMVAMHVSLLFLMIFIDLTLGALMFHVFTFDRSWLPKKHYQSV